MTNYTYVITATATQDYKEANEWYAHQNVPGLAKRFREAIRSTLLRIKQQPHSFAIRYKHVRIAHAHKFPYAIHYYYRRRSDRDHFHIVSG